MNKLKNKKIGLSIVGAGTKSVAYAGALKAFEEFGIKTSAIVGSSGGSVIAGAYALGKTPEEIYQHFKAFKPYSIISFRSIITGKIIDYDKWEKHARIFSGNMKIQNTPIKLFIQATNITHPELEYFETGDLAKAVIASSAIFSPYGFKHKRYMDAEYNPEYGINKLREFGCDTAIILTLKENKKRNSLFDILKLPQVKAFEANEQLHPADYKIEIQIQPTFLFSQKHTEKLYTEGYKQTRYFLETNL